MAFQALLTRLAFTIEQAQAIIQEGITQPEDLRTYTQGDIKAFFKHLSARNIHAPFAAQHNLQILRYWVEKRIPLNLPVDPELFTVDVRDVWGEKMKAAADDQTDSASKKVSISAPAPFKKDTKWRTWKEQFMTYLGTKYGQCKAPLTFIIREEDDPADPLDFDDDYEMAVFLTPHVGDTFKKDNNAVYDELKALLIQGPAYTWIRPFDRMRNGRAAWKALINHYEGTAEQNKIKEAAYATIRNATYAGERRNWSFDSYYHAHQDAHYDLENYGEYISESKKVTDFLRGISDPQCAVAKGIVLATPAYLNDFTAAALFIASTLNVTLNNTNQKQRNIGATSTQEGGRRNNNNKGRGRGGKNNKNNLTRSYTPEEWRALSPQERKKVLEACAKAKANKNKNQNQTQSQDGKRTTAAVGSESQTQDDDEASYIDVHAGNIAEILHKNNISSASTADAGDHMTSRIGAANLRKKSRISMMSSRRNIDPNGRIIAKSQWKNTNPKVAYARSELDSRADTCCAGMTAQVLEYTGQTCEVYPYNPTYKPRKNVPIVKAVTAYDTPSGETLILCLNQALYFGNEMEHTLLNPNQMRSHGIVVDDCPISLSHRKDATHSLYVPDMDL
jgi:hypothetical protein